MTADEIAADAPRPNVKLLVLAALTTLVLIAGVTRSLQLAGEDASAGAATAGSADAGATTGDAGATIGDG